MLQLPLVLSNKSSNSEHSPSLREPSLSVKVYINNGKSGCGCDQQIKGLRRPLQFYLAFGAKFKIRNVN